MGKLVNRETGEIVDAPDDESAFPLLESGKYVAPDANGNVPMLDKAGKPYLVPLAEVERGFARGGAVEAPEQVQERKWEKLYGEAPIRTFVEGAARTVTFGLSDAFQDAEGVEQRRQRNPVAAITGEVAGALTPVGASKLIGKAGQAAKGLVAGAGATRAARVGGLATQGAVEGSLFGAGMGVSELALSDDPLTAERALSTLGSNALYGAAFGGVAGTAGGLLAEGASAAKGAAQRWQQRTMQKVDGAAAGGQSFDDLAQLDAAGLKAAREAELGAIETGRAAERKALAGDLKAFRDDTYASGYWEAGTSQVKRAAKAPAQKSLLVDEFGRAPVVAEEVAPTLSRAHREARKVAKTADAALRRLTDNVAGLERAPGRALDPLERQAAALTTMLAEPTVQASSKLPDLQRALERNQALQARIIALGEKPASARLAAIDDALATASTRRGGGLVAEMAKGPAFGAVLDAAGAIGVPGMLAVPLAAKAAKVVGELVEGKGLAGLTSRLAQGAAASKAAVARRVDLFMRVGDRAVAGVRRAVPIGSARVLAGVRFAHPDVAQATPARPYAKAPDDLVRVFRDREREIRAQVERAPDGRWKMAMGARRGLHERLAGLWAVAPALANRLEAAAAAKLEFLASKLPVRPGGAHIPTGPDRWRPSEMQIRQFARYVDAAERPERVLDRMIDGKMTPEDAETLRTVFPALYTDIAKQLVHRLPELRQQLPYERRLMLSIYFGVPVDPAMEPRVLARLQATYAQEEATAGGTSEPVPRARALQKSVPQPTQAQRLSER